MHNEKLWTKDFISITIINFFIFLVFYILLTVLPLYLVGTFHAGTDKVGLVIAFFLAAAILIRPFAGQWVSKGSQKKIFMYSAIAFLLATMLYPFATNLTALLILRVFHGLTFGIITTAMGTICAELIPPSRRGEGLSYFSMAMSLAMVFGPFIGITLVNMNAYNATFIICMISSAVAIVLAPPMRIPERTKESDMLLEKGDISWNDLFDKNAAPFAFATFILACAYSGISVFLPLYAKDLGLVETASYFFIVLALFILISRPFTGRWFDQRGAKVIIYPCLILFMVGMFLLSQVHSNAMFLVAAVIIGIGYGSVTPIFQTQIINSVEPQRVGFATSLFFNSLDAGMSLGAYVLGIVAGVAGYRSIYLVGAVFIVFAVLQYFVLTQKKEVLSIQSNPSLVNER